ncbi:hypothetical protein EX30DRAFT_394601 [Ascodesmis nigricans]|uniref:Uncharacterized protein n=1 Tax=Ascodesmis nigricans TaxID=341454 RepID=A0A4S2N2M9_9PEZI|nr:hypothetical protein EX30DRAFT_394601 [Ascodesmis nigricans]
MRFLPSLLLLAASAILPSAFAKENTAAPSPKLEKFQKLTADPKASTAGLIKLNSALYNDITSAPRDYSVMVLLTAMEPAFQCAMCKMFAPEYALLAKSWTKQHPNGDSLFFGELDFKNGKEAFMRLGVSTAPMLYLFPPTIGPNAKPEHAKSPILFDFTQTDIPAESVAVWIERHIGTQIKVNRPFDYSKLLVGGGALLIGLTVLKIAFNTLKPAIYSKNLWAAVSLILILLFTSGHMFNQIRNVPYVVNNGRGGVSFIAGGFSNQFGLETQIVAMIYAVLSFCTINLALKMPQITDPGRQKVAVWAWSIVMLVTFSFLMNLFRQKNGGYPFKLPPFM